MTTLETPRLILRPFQESDLDDLCALYSDPDVMRYLTTGVLDREETAVRLKRVTDHWQTLGYGVWAVHHKDECRFIGRCGIVMVPEFAERMLTYTFASAYWGQGYATEAARAALDYAFTQLKLPRVIATTAAENVASRSVMRKLGMTFEKVVPFLGRESMLHGLNNPHASP